MRKNLVSSIVAASLLLGSTAAMAETRPSANRFTQPASAKANAADGDTDYAKLFLIGTGSILGIWALIEAFKDNSPKAPNA